MYRVNASGSYAYQYRNEWTTLVYFVSRSFAKSQQSYNCIKGSLKNARTKTQTQNTRDTGMMSSGGGGGIDTIDDIDVINQQNRKRRRDGTDNPMLLPALPSSNVDYLHFGRDMGLPWLPYAFTCTCAFCGVTGVTPDRR